MRLSSEDGFAGRVSSWNPAAGPTRTTRTPPATLRYATRYDGRVRAVETSVTGPWSSVQTFLTPTAPPVPPPPVPPPGGGDPSDQLSLSSVSIVLGPSNFGSWPVASTITNIKQGNGDLCIYHTQLGQWPTTPFFGDPGVPLEGNQWVFAFIGGRWYGGAADWYRPGQACKGVTAPEIGHDAFSQEPLHSWVPRPGEQYGLAASTPARAWPAMSTLDQRTNTVLAIWK